MKTFVTGATGFLGSALCPSLREIGHEVTETSSKSCNLLDPTSLEQFENQRYDMIFHLATWTQAGDFCMYHPGEQWLINQKIHTTLLSWWQTKQPQAKLVSIGTSCAYDPELALTEDNYLAGTPIESLLSYGMTKRMLYVGQLAFHTQYGLNGLHIIPSTLYGPHYPLDGRQMHFIFDLIRKIICGKAFGDPVVLWGDGSQHRELIHIDDFVKILIELSGKVDNEVVNVGAGEEHPIRLFAQLICEKLDFDFDSIQFDETKYVGARSKCLDVTRLHQVMPNLELTPLKDGLSAVIESLWAERDRLPRNTK